MSAQSTQRFALLAAVLPIALVVTWDAPPPLPQGDATGPRRPLPAVERPAPAPEVVTRAEWGADEELNTEPVTYTGPSRAVFIHHTNHPDDYDCADAPEMLRSMHTDHVSAQGWDDIGYNFVVDKCGTVYEGRGGGKDRYVLGAHTTGFNMDSVGIAALGAFTDPAAVPGELITAIAEVAAWKLRPGTDPRERVRMVSTNDDSRVPEGDPAELEVVSGHRDIVQTDCPGDALYAQLPDIREEAARLRVAGGR
ncbi:peptidoglycan recognition protein family protein [Streptomyces profundus]|uniref:peptidoglycan recognition protein family protein n=1 Tax=Streptomyces profundus TaxID=2867410 RepID=UPI001D16B94D|nr:peptidoglycan recognition protein [Streptomyces sp. MA3_2.13]UED85020.1 peptidoglycan recognition protein [Streptomyces sp. MA3_2.13]